MNHLTILLGWTKAFGLSALDWVKAWGLVSVGLILLTWAFFLAVMRLREMRDAGELSFKVSVIRCVAAYIVLVVGLIIDVLVNWIVCTVVLLEIPKEALTTTRLCRWYHTADTGWYTRVVRIRFVRFGQIMLDAADTDGKHIK